MLEAFGFVVRGQAIHERPDFAFHDIGELMKRETDAVIGDAVLREVVGANFFTAVAGFDLAATLGG